MHLPPSVAEPPPADPLPDSHGSSSGPLSGSWAAVRWEYETGDGARSVDLIADLGAAVTLSMSDGDYVLSCALNAEPTRTVAGALRVAADRWIDFAPRAGVPERVEFRRGAGTLVLRSDASGWDFTGAGEEPASFTAVLVRL